MLLVFASVVPAIILNCVERQISLTGGGAVLAGILPGLGSTMIGANKLLRLGQGSLGLTAIWPSGPRSCSTRFPGQEGG